MKNLIRSSALLILLCLPYSSSASDLYRDGAFSSLASDRTARVVGDLLTVVVYENASASNSAGTNTRKNTRLDGTIMAGSGLDETGRLGLAGSSDNNGETVRSGRMVAQISAVVEQVMPNGDLRVAGAQEIQVGGEHTHIRVEGRVRQSDISSANAVLSSRLADARIVYDGKGFVSRGAKPGIVTRIFSWLGLL
ncbi:flagellar basal body L-ring protein FlgH [bacterium]|nr:MAG: flagellar basal body L-ring protein FlgH [bacterium]